MIYNKQRKRSRVPGGFFYLEDEKTKTRVFGSGQGDYVKLKDECGNTWVGSAVRNPDGSVVYSFRDPKGRSLTGVSDTLGVTLRDGMGNTWKGFID